MFLTGSKITDALNSKRATSQETEWSWEVLCCYCMSVWNHKRCSWKTGAQWYVCLQCPPAFVFFAVYWWQWVVDTWQFRRTVAASCQASNITTDYYWISVASSAFFFCDRARFSSTGPVPLLLFADSLLLLCVVT